MTIIGIDPGKDGGIAIYFDNGNLEVVKMPDTEKDTYEQLRSVSDEDPRFVNVFLEKVHSFPGQGVSSTFKFGQGYGFLRGIICSLEYPLHDVEPRRWQQNLGCLTKGNKNVTKQKAQQLFPHIKITHKTADAVLIALWGKWFLEGKWGR